MFRWREPAEDGGCPIQSYELYLDEGASGVFVKTDSALLDNRAYLREHRVLFNSTQSGKTFRYKLKALNEIGETDSVIKAQILASAPSAPLSAPVSDPLITTVDRIKVSWQFITDDGFSEILSYSLEMDDGSGGDFASVVGESSPYLLQDYTVTENVNKGTLYRLRYRSLN